MLLGLFKSAEEHARVVDGDGLAHLDIDDDAGADVLLEGDFAALLLGLEHEVGDVDVEAFLVEVAGDLDSELLGGGRVLSGGLVAL